MIDWNQILQNVGVWGTFIVAVSVFLFYMGRGVYNWVTAGSTQSNVMAKMASDQTARVNALADVRFEQIKKIGELEKRLAEIEPIVKEVPKLRDDYQKTLAELELVNKLYQESLQREIVKDDMIVELQRKVQTLEQKVAIYERAEIYEQSGGGIDDTRPLIRGSDITDARRPDRRTGGDDGGDGGGYGSWSGGDGERNG